METNGRRNLFFAADDDDANNCDHVLHISSDAMMNNNKKVTKMLQRQKRELNSNPSILTAATTGVTVCMEPEMIEIY